MEHVCFMVLWNCDVIWILNLKWGVFFFSSSKWKMKEETEEKKKWWCVRVLRMSATWNEKNARNDSIQREKEDMFSVFWLSNERSKPRSRGENFKKGEKAENWFHLGEVESLMRRKKISPIFQISDEYK